MRKGTYPWTFTVVLLFVFVTLLQGRQRDLTFLIASLRNAISLQASQTFHFTERSVV